MSKESELQAQIYELALNLGLVPIRFNSGKLVGSGYSYAYSWGPDKLHDGIADLAIILPNGKTAWMEIKRENGRVRESQLRFREEIENNGRLWFLIDNILDCRDILFKLREENLDD